ncbi:MAG: (deoxy)nucleoside triphosphate pyrophosphohydrolase [Bacillota bacterium]
MRQVDVVGAVIVNGAGEVLCAQRSDRMAQPGLWEFPGGKIEPGESPAQCLRREIREELHCEIEVGELIADITHPYPEITVRLLTYRARLVGGTPTPTEHARLAWVPVAELARLPWAPADIPTVERLQRG